MSYFYKNDFSLLLSTLKTDLQIKSTRFDVYPCFTDTGYLHTVYFHCHNYVIILDIVPCLNNDRFLRANKILLLNKKQ